MGGLKLSRREIGALLALLAILLFLPLAVSRLVLSNWGELTWRHPMELAFLEWTGAFLQAFLFLLLLEESRHSGRWRYAWFAAGFFAMAGMHFAYALSGPGGETASWLKLLGMTLGGVCACGCLFSGEKPEPSTVRVLVRLVLPVALVLGVLIWIPFGLRQLLPTLIVAATGQMTLFGRLAVIIPGALFFLAALPWLRSYLKTWRREGLLFTIVLLGFAQSMLVWRDARGFGVLWWGVHLTLILLTLLATLSLLITSIRHSVVWKLIFSLGLTFGLTVILTAGLLQGHSQKRFAETLYRQIHARHQLLLAKHTADVQVAIRNLDNLGRRATEQLDLRRGGFPETGTPAWLVAMAELDTAAWRGQFPACGYMTCHGRVLPAEAPPASETIQALLAEISAAMESVADDRILWTSIRLDRQTRCGMMLAAKPLLIRGRPVGYFFKAMDASWLWDNGVTAEKRLDRDREGRILFDARRGRILLSHLPKEWSEAADGPAAEDAVRQLMAAAYDAGPDGRTWLVSILARPFLASACRVPDAGWVVVHLLDIGTLPGEGGGVTYAFAGVGMAVLLIGFVALLLLLNIQLARPLQQLLRATERVERGDLSIRIDARDSTELGVVSRSFDHMLERMQAAHGELEQTVTARTAALAEVQQANQAKATFFASVSHELRTPLHGILSCSRLGTELAGATSPKAVEYFDNINRSGQRLLKLINEILDLAKLESGYMEFNYQPANLLPLLQQASGELAALFAEKEIRLACPSPPDDIRVVIDVDMMRRVFVNLLGNALKFARQGTSVTVEFCRGTDSITVRVLDEGPGIPEGETEKIFEKFFQGRHGTIPGGTGIGLATCKEIVTAHGGTIHAGNRPEGGASFSFTLSLSDHHPRNISSRKMPRNE
jgi:signal transduction histidine kinase